MSPRRRLSGAAPAVLLWLGLAAAPPPAPAQPDSAEALYRQSQQDYDDRRYLKALEGFMDVLLKKPNFPGAREGLTKASKALLNEEKAGIEKERRELMSDILQMRKRGDRASSRDEKPRESSWEAPGAAAASSMNAAELLAAPDPLDIGAAAPAAKLPKSRRPQSGRGRRAAAAAPAAPPAPAPAPKKAAPPMLDAQGFYLKGLRAYSVGDLNGAIRFWKACLEAEPEHPKAKKALERALLEKK